MEITDNSIGTEDVKIKVKLIIKPDPIISDIAEAKRKQLIELIRKKNPEKLYKNKSKKKQFLLDIAMDIYNVTQKQIDHYYEEKEKEIQDNKVRLLSSINSQTAKNGYKEEANVCEDLNHNPEIRKLFTPMLGNYNVFSKVPGNSKCDIQTKDGSLRAQVKKYNDDRFQQLHRGRVSTFTKNIPELDEHSQILKDLVEYPLLPNGTHVDKSKPIKKLCTSNYSQEILDDFLDLLNKNKRQILEYAFYGIGSEETRPNYLFGVTYEKNEDNEQKRKLILFKIKDIINYLETLNFKISKKKTCILLGDARTISLQRKGGDSGKKSGNNLQIKLILSNLIDKVCKLEHKL